VYPSAERAPRWARRFEESGSVTAQQHVDPRALNVGEKLRNLESLIKELREQLDTTQETNSSSGVPSPPETDDTPGTGLQKQFGRLVLQDASRSRYISSGFWSEVNDEVR
jgi:hypothetical protein